jgi:hypothetical protein
MMKLTINGDSNIIDLLSKQGAVNGLQDSELRSKSKTSLSRA